MPGPSGQAGLWSRRASKVISAAWIVKSWVKPPLCKTDLGGSSKYSNEIFVRLKSIRFHYEQCLTMGRDRIMLKILLNRHFLGKNPFRLRNQLWGVDSRSLTWSTLAQVRGNFRFFEGRPRMFNREGLPTGRRNILCCPNLWRCKIREVIAFCNWSSRTDVPQQVLKVKKPLGWLEQWTG